MLFDDKVINLNIKLFRLSGLIFLWGCINLHTNIWFIIRFTVTLDLLITWSNLSFLKRFIAWFDVVKKKRQSFQKKLLIDKVNIMVVVSQISE